MAGNIRCRFVFGDSLVQRNLAYLFGSGTVEYGPNLHLVEIFSSRTVARNVRTHEFTDYTDSDSGRNADSGSKMGWKNAGGLKLPPIVLTGA